MNTDNRFLVQHINKKLFWAANLCAVNTPLPMHDIRGFSRNHRLGDLIIQFNSQEYADTAVKTQPTWVPVINSSLQLKLTPYPIIVHRLPTTFNPDNQSEVVRLKEANVGLLDTPSNLTSPSCL